MASIGAGFSAAFAFIYTLPASYEAYQTSTTRLLLPLNVSVLVKPFMNAAG